MSKFDGGDNVNMECEKNSLSKKSPTEIQHHIILGHLSFKPSSQRIYSSSPIGDFRADDGGDGSPVAGGGDTTAPAGPEVDGRPAISSCSSVTTRPFAVISLLRIIRLWGNKPRDVWTCCLIAGLLDGVKEVSEHKYSIKKKVRWR